MNEKITTTAPMSAQRVLATLLLAIGAITILVAPLRADEPAQWKQLEENWYRIEMAGHPAGWMGGFVHERGDHMRTTNSMMISIERGAVPIRMEMNTTMIETRDGKPVEIRMRQVMGQQPVETTWVFTDEGITETSRQGGRELVREHPLPEGDWLMPRAVKRLLQSKLKEGAEVFSYRTVDPSSGMRLISAIHSRTGEGTFKHDNREIPVTIWRSTNDVISPMHATEHYDEDGRMVYQEMNLGMGIMVMRLAEREAAQKQEQGGGAPEMLFQTFVKPDKPIERVMQTRMLSMRLKTKQDELPALPSTGAQRFTLADDKKSGELIVNIDEPLPASQDERADESYLQASPMIDSNDEMIQSLARRVVRAMPEADRADVMKKAEAMRAFVFEYVSDASLDVPFATASETARTRAGDCSEHAVLLAALLRAADIPARVASGLVYVDQFAGAEGIFGWHMWTQAIVDGKWIDLDATLPVRHHAGHIITNVSSLAGGMGSDQGSMLALIGNLEIEIIETK